MLSNRLVKTVSKLVYPFGWNLFTRKEPDTHTHTQTDRHTDTQTNCSENITPPRFRGGVKMLILSLSSSIVIDNKKPKDARVHIIHPKHEVLIRIRILKNFSINVGY